MLKWIFSASFFCLVMASARADLVAIEKIYNKQCATCHGNNGDGKGRAGASLVPVPTDFTSDIARQKLTAEKIQSAIRNGVAGSSMVGYGRRFDDATIVALSEFIQQRFMGMSAQQDASVDNGKALYAQHCAVCHGDNGSSAVWAKNGLNPAPRDFTTQVAKEELSRERMILAVTHGRPGTAMMPFTKRLTTSEIESIVDFVRQQFMGINNDAQQKTSPDTVKSKNEFPQDLVGNPEAGKLFYESNCYVCHGLNGDGNGPRASFNMPRPRDFTSDTSHVELDRPRLFNSISKGRPGTVMPAWATVLNEQQIADVAEYVYQSFIQSQKKKH